jgi:four helix bundle protein
MFVKLPKTEVARVLGRQVLRSATSVGANYREACRARSDTEFISKIGDCLKELEESAYWLELLVDSGTVSSLKMAALLQETNELLAIFTTISKKAKARIADAT